MVDADLDPSPADGLYERDFHAWALAQMRALAVRDDASLDIENLIEEVEALGRSQRHAISSRLEVLIAHLLKFRMQPERATSSWRRTVRVQRRELARLIERSPSLRSYPTEIFVEAYRDGVRLAADETRIDPGRFPAEPPFTLDQILDPGFDPA